MSGFMFSPPARLFGFLFVTGLLLTLFYVPVAAQSDTPEPAEACVACHEEQYYLYDTGKWYCLCSVPMNCSCCHGGDPNAVTKDAAHLGMVANPVQGDASTCQKCHPDEYALRVQQFASLGGISSPAPLAQDYIHSSVHVELASTWEVMHPEPPQTWRLVGLAVAVLGLVVSLGLITRCCLLDRTQLLRKDQ